MHEVGSSSPNIQPQDTNIEQLVKTKTEPKSAPLTKAVAKNGKEEPKGLGDRILSKLQEVFGSKSESTANAPSLKFSQKVIGLLTPKKKDLPARTDNVAKQNLTPSTTAHHESDDFAALDTMLRGGPAAPDDLPPPLPEGHYDTSFPDYDPPEFTPDHLPGGSRDNNAPIPTDLPPTLPEETKAAPKRPEKREDAAPATLSQESTTISRPGQNPAILKAKEKNTESNQATPKRPGNIALDLRAKEAHKAFEAKKASEAQMVIPKEMAIKLGHIMGEISSTEKSSTKSIGQVPFLIDELVEQNPILKLLPSTMGRLSNYKEIFKSAEDAAKKFDAKLDSILQDNTLSPIEKSSQIAKLYNKDYEAYSKAFSPCVTLFDEFRKDIEPYGLLNSSIDFSKFNPETKKYGKLDDNQATPVGFRLRSDGAAPLQRLGRHALLIQDLMKNVPEGHSIQTELKVALVNINASNFEAGA